MWSTLVVHTAKFHSMNILGRVLRRCWTSSCDDTQRDKHKGCVSSCVLMKTLNPLRGVYSLCADTVQAVNRRHVLLQFTRHPSICWQWGLDMAAIGTLNVFTLPNIPVLCLPFSRHGPHIYTDQGHLSAWFHTPIYPLRPYTYWGFHWKEFRGI